MPRNANSVSDTNGFNLHAAYRHISKLPDSSGPVPNRVSEHGLGTRRAFNETAPSLPRDELVALDGGSRGLSPL